MLFHPLRCSLFTVLGHAQRRTLAHSAAGLAKAGASLVTRPLPPGALHKLTPQAVLEDRRALLSRAPPTTRDDGVAWQRTRATRLVVSGLPTDIARGALEAELAEVFARYGEVRIIGVGGHDGALDGHAYVEYADPQSTSRALHACYSPRFSLAGVRPEVQYAARAVETLFESRMLRATLPGGKVDVEELQAWASRYGTAVVWAGHYHNIAFIKYTDQGAATRAMRAYNAFPIIMNNILLELNYTSSRKAVQSNVEEKQDRREKPPQPSAEICVGSDERATEQYVRAVFARFGEIQSIVIDKSPGSGDRLLIYVRFASQDEATAAIEAWKNGTLPSEPPVFFANYSTRVSAPTYRLRLRGSNCSAKDLYDHLREFTPFIWRVTADPRPGINAIYVDFDTVEHAIAARDALDGRDAGLGVQLHANFVAAFSTRTLSASGGDAAAAFEKRLVAESCGALTAAERDMAVRLFRQLWVRTDWVKKRLLPHYFGPEWDSQFGGSTPELALEVLRRREELVKAEAQAAAVDGAPGVQEDLEESARAAA